MKQQTYCSIQVLNWGIPLLHHNTIPIVLSQKGILLGQLAQNYFPEAKPCQDHTSSGGKMMMVKVSASANLNIWCQEVVVRPNTNYHFVAFVTGLRTNDPPVILLEINGELLSIGTIGSFACSWQRVKGDWNAGNNATANICLRVSDEDIGAGDGLCTG